MKEKEEEEKEQEEKKEEEKEKEGGGEAGGEGYRGEEEGRGVRKEKQLGMKSSQDMCPELSAKTRSRSK